MIIRGHLSFKINLHNRASLEISHRDKPDEYSQNGTAQLIRRKKPNTYHMSSLKFFLSSILVAKIIQVIEMIKLLKLSYFLLKLIRIFDYVDREEQHRKKEQKCINYLPINKDNHA